MGRTPSTSNAVLCLRILQAIRVSLLAKATANFPRFEPEFAQGSTDKVSAQARFHADNASWKIFKGLQQGKAFDPLAQNKLAILIKTNQTAGGRSETNGLGGNKPKDAVAGQARCKGFNQLPFSQCVHHIEVVQQGESLAGNCCLQNHIRIVEGQPRARFEGMLGNQFIAILKDNSLVSVVGVWDLMFVVRTVGRSDFKLLEMLITASIVCWLMSIILELVQKRIEFYAVRGK